MKIDYNKSVLPNFKFISIGFTLVGHNDAVGGWVKGL